jgi:hypothetical protein
MAIANEHRAKLGLPAVERLGDIHDAAVRCGLFRRRPGTSLLVLSKFSARLALAGADLQTQTITHVPV